MAKVTQLVNLGKNSPLLNPLLKLCYLLRFTCYCKTGKHGCGFQAMPNIGDTMAVFSFLQNIDEHAMGVTAGCVNITSTNVLHEASLGLCVTGSAAPREPSSLLVLISVLSSITCWP